jgi:hypothetical protein
MVKGPAILHSYTTQQLITYVAYIAHIPRLTAYLQGLDGHGHVQLGGEDAQPRSAPVEAWWGGGAVQLEYIHTLIYTNIGRNNG